MYLAGVYSPGLISLIQIISLEKNVSCEMKFRFSSDSVKFIPGSVQVHILSHAGFPLTILYMWNYRC